MFSSLDRVLAVLRHSLNAEGIGVCQELLNIYLLEFVVLNSCCSFSQHALCGAELVDFKVLRIIFASNEVVVD